MVVKEDRVPIITVPTVALAAVAVPISAVVAAVATPVVQPVINRRVGMKTVVAAVDPIVQEQIPLVLRVPIRGMVT